MFEKFNILNLEKTKTMNYLFFLYFVKTQTRRKLLKCIYIDHISFNLYLGMISEYSIKKQSNFTLFSPFTINQPLLILYEY